VKLRLALALGLVFVGIQAFPPERRNAPLVGGAGLEAAVRVPPAVSSLLRRSCYDCHSQEVRWPWWSRVAPASWLIASDVAAARHAMDFSRWDPSRGREKLDGVCELARTGEMPPGRYTVVHRGTRLSKTEAELVCSWAVGAGSPRGGG
jgi:hypothetical protein